MRNPLKPEKTGKQRNMVLDGILEPIALRGTHEDQASILKVSDEGLGQRDGSVA